MTMPEAPEPEITPELDEVHQQEHIAERAEPAVPVHIDGPVNVRQLPSRVAVLRTITLDTTAQPIVGKDARRSALTLISIEQPFHVALGASDAQALNGLTWPAGVPLVIRHAGPVWARAVNDPASLSFMIDQWAD